MDTLDDIFVVGDFNLPGLEWDVSDDCTHYVASNALTAKEILFTDNMTSSGLFQISNVKNSLSRQLDLVFSSVVINGVASETNLILCAIDVYHPPILITFCLEQGSLNVDSVTPPRFNFRKADFVKLNDLLANIDFDTILNDNNDIETQTSNFYSAVFECFEQSIPYTRQKTVSSSAPWYNRELRTLRNRRNKLWQRFLKSKSDSDYSNYLSSYNDFSGLSDELYGNYIRLMQSNLIDDPKSFWRFINLKKKSDGYPSTLKYKDHSSKDPKVVTNHFADFFSLAFTNSDFEPEEDYFAHMNNCVQTTLTSIQINHESVVRKISRLKDDFSFGPDGLPPIVLKNCADILANPLTALFQKSLSLGIFPSIWKCSFIVPIHKNGSKSDICNYRPIAKLSCIPKLFESIVYDSLYFHCKPLFSDNQHGFLKARSTTTNLIEFTSQALNMMEAGNEVDVVFTDFSKAFDRISHEVILFKLGALGFPPQILRWVGSYLKDRIYHVLFRSSVSTPFSATSGVPQGSHLGPIFFILAINDVECVIKNSSISIYADDMKIYKRISNTTDRCLLQSDLNNFSVWCARNNLELNVSKCLSITYSRKRGQSIPRDYYIGSDAVARASSVRDLGVICDSELNFRSHIDRIVSQANSALGFVKRWSKEFDDPHVTKALYSTFVRPLLEYASQVWSPYHEVHIKRIEAVQRRYLRFALRGIPFVDMFNLPPYQDRLRLIDLQPLSKRRVVADVVFIHQLVTGGIDSPALLGKINLNVNSRDLRTVPVFRIDHHRTDYGKNEPVSRMLHQANKHGHFIDFNITKRTLKKLFYLS